MRSLVSPPSLPFITIAPWILELSPLVEVGAGGRSWISDLRDFSSLHSVLLEALSFIRGSHEESDQELFIGTSYLRTETGSFKFSLEYSPLPEVKSAQMEEFIVFARAFQLAKDYKAIIQKVVRPKYAPPSYVEILNFSVTVWEK